MQASSMIFCTSSNVDLVSTKNLVNPILSKNSINFFNFASTMIELELEFTIMPLWASQYKTVIKM